MKTSLHATLRTRRAALGLAAALSVPLLASCGGSDEPAPPTFVFRLHGFPASMEFRARAGSAAVAAQAREQLKLPVEQRRLFAIGPIARGDGGVNTGWGWHFTDLALAEMAIELCDGTPDMVDADLNYWVGTVRSFCPWASYVHAELP